jgi:hypothetical protein
MNYSLHIIPGFTMLNALAAIGIAFVFITIMSLVKEPTRQKLNALSLQVPVVFIGRED